MKKHPIPRLVVLNPAPPPAFKTIDTLIKLAALNNLNAQQAIDIAMRRIK